MTYGADNVMQFYIPGLYASAGTGPLFSWATDIHLPGSSQMGLIQSAILDRGNSTYFTRIPAQDIIVSDADTDDKHVTAMRDRNGGWIMVFTPTGKSFEIQTGGLKGCNVSASWYDTLVGGYTAFEYAQCGGESTVRVFAPLKTSVNVDWVLVLEVR